MKLNTMLRSGIAKTFAGSFLLRILSILSTLAGSVILARVLGPEQFGIYAYVFAIVAMLSLPAKFGLPTLIVRETAQGRSLEQWGRVKGIWRWSGMMIASTSSVIVLLGFLTVWLLGDMIPDVYRSTLYFGLILIPFWALGNARGAALRGLKRVVRGQLPETVIRPATLALLVLFLPLWGGDRTAENAMLLHILAAMLAFTAGGFLLWLARPPEISGISPDLSNSRQWLKAMFPLGLIAAMQTISHQTDILMLGLYVPPEEVGIYKVVVSGAALSLLGLQMANLVIAPRLASYYAKEDGVRLQKLSSMGALLSSALTLPVALLFLMFGEQVLSYVFGPVYAEGHYPLVVLTLGQMVNALFGSVGNLLNMSGNERLSLVCIVFATLINIALNIILIPYLGLMGAAFSTAVSVSSLNFMMWILAKKKVGVDASIFYYLRRG